MILCLWLKKDTCLLSGGGTRGLYTQNVYNFLLTIPEPSVELASGIVNKNYSMPYY